jgi:cyclopropane-fatty-acyl-phospholipid synthase
VTAPARLERLSSPLDPLLVAVAGRIGLAAASRIRRGCLSVQLPDGSRRVFGDEGSELRGEMHIHDMEALRRLLLGGEVGGGEAYMEGLWSSPDLVALISLAVANRTDLALSKGWWRVPARVIRTVDHRRNRNTKGGARRNIRAHYDLGNDFYRLWLDERMVYTCAYYTRPGATLEEAQLAKMNHVARKLRLTPGQTVFEAGCGWGALALHLAQHYGAKVRAYNISREQLAYARERARTQRLEDRVEFVEDDYRNIRGTCDRFVSVGMLEHVGPEHYRQLGRVICDCLAPDGAGLIHTIGRNQPAPNNPWTERRIFPGSLPPSLSEITRIFEPYDFSVLDVENLRLHYARTLEHWLARFEAQEEQVGAMFDERLVRMWRLYLSGSIAAFRAGALDLFQVLFNRPGGNNVAWTRASLYRP